MDQPPEWYDPFEVAYWRMTRQIEQEFITGVDMARMGPGKAPKKKTPPLRKRATGRVETVAGEVKRAAATVFVAVIVRSGFKNYPYSSRFDSNRNDDGWFALMGEDKQKLVVEALAKARAFGANYEVAVGTLDEMVVIPTFFGYETL